ncbi:MAG TPA: hypothetical protein VF213_11250 [Dongiaceae bacterium]
MKRSSILLVAAAALLLAASSGAQPARTAQQKLASVQYLVGTWSCTHTVGAFSGPYTTTYAPALGNRWLRQTYEFPAPQAQENAQPVHGEFIMGYDEGRQAWVRFGAMSTGKYFPIRMTETADGGWSWKYVSFFKRQSEETPGADATFTKKSDSEYVVDGPSYMLDGTRVTEHHSCKKL